MTILPQRNEHRAKEKNRPSRDHRNAQQSIGRDPHLPMSHSPTHMSTQSRYQRTPIGPSQRQYFNPLPNTPKRMRGVVSSSTSSKHVPVKSNGRNSDDEDSVQRVVELEPTTFDAVIPVVEETSSCEPAIDIARVEYEFEQVLKGQGLVIKPMQGDGACLFRAIADQIYGDEEMHGTVRKLCMDYVVANRDHFADFVANEDFDEYVRRKRLLTAHGNHVEIQAIAEMFNRPVHVYEYSSAPKNIFQPASSGIDNPPLRLTYHCASHYNSLVDPNAPTCGVGLGLPGLVPGLADKTQVSAAIEESERSALEQQMLADKLAASDWEATQNAIEESIALQSYQDWLKTKKAPHRSSPKRENDGRISTSSPKRKTPPPPPQTGRTACFPFGHAPTASSSKSSEKRDGKAIDDLVKEDLVMSSSNSCSLTKTSSAAPIPIDQDDDYMLQQVLALSQQEYYDQQRRQPCDTFDDNQPSTSKQ